MYTSAFLALAALTIPEERPLPQPHWLTDYSTAKKAARAQNQPLALFFGTGQDGFHQVSRLGKLNDQTVEILSKHYVVAYLNLNNPNQAELADALGITLGKGLVITDRGGRFQEYQHNGALSPIDLVDTLTRHADPYVSTSIEGKCVTLTAANFSAEVLKSEQPVLVDFWAEWCGPCRRMVPVMTELGSHFRSKAKVGKLNIDEQRALAQQYNITAMPTFLIFKDGEVVDRVVGATTMTNLASRIEALIAK